MILEQSVSKGLPEFLNQECKKWSFGNQVLYAMCSENPLHTDADIIVGKIWLIGRSYSAAIERRKGATEQSDDFYYEVVAPKLLSVGKELDERVKKLNQYSYPTEGNLNEVLNTHKFLTDVFYDITNLDKRSLASKYLHFHCPRMFYIYDSRSSQGIRKYVRVDKQRLYKHYPCGCDTEYADFCVRMIEFQEYVERTEGKLLSARDIDNLLLYY